MEQFSVKIGDGSGCLFHPMTDKYAYVLTARHVVAELKQITIMRQVLVNGEVREEPIQIIAGPFFHPDQNKDAAIIKVEFKEDIDNLLAIFDPLADKKGFVLTGHPKSRRGKQYSYRGNDVEIKAAGEHGYIEAEVTNRPGYEEIKGQSGGGIIKEINGGYLLAGIQQKMSAEDQYEILGRIEFMPISFYTEIVADNPTDLAELLPHYLTCFSFLKNQAHKLEGHIDENNIIYAREYLRGITDKIVENNLTPYFIKRYFEEKLLVFNQSKNTLYEKGLWVAWLEFLIIMNVIKDNSIIEDHIPDIFNSIRLIFSSTRKDWTSEFENIIKSNFKGLKGDMKIIVSTNSIPIGKSFLKTKFLNIARVRQVRQNQLQIDEGLNQQDININLIHLNAFQTHCIVLKENDYKHLDSYNEKDLIKKLKDEYETLLR